MNPKYWTLVTVVAGLLAWAGVETQRLLVVRKQMAASLQLQAETSHRVELAQLKHNHALAEKK